LRGLDLIQQGIESVTNRTFRKLHEGPEILLLPNAWDAGSARLIESLGAKAIATTSAGLAWSRGYPDGDTLPVKQLLVTVNEIVRVIRVPLTVDIEGGYSDDPSAVGELTRQVIDAGVVGINIEDGPGPPDLLCRKIEAVRQSAIRAGVDLFINARTDVYLRNFATGNAAIDEVSHRAEQYRAAGCDGLFVPGLADGPAIDAVLAAIDQLPLNIMLVPNLSSVDALQIQGVRRLSTGSAIAQAVLGRARQLAAGLLAGSVAEMFTNAVEYSATNKLFQDRPSPG
jgi:2-methylisocitrate lyase-like PEP mutase family enzyme